MSRLKSGLTVFLCVFPRGEAPPRLSDMDAAKQVPSHRMHTYISAQGTRLAQGVLVFVIAWLSGTAYLTGVAEAMHEIDHRFTVEGHVCGADGRPASEAKVIVKDARVSIGTAVFTDSQGYYKAVLHLHNDNRGDPIVVTALEQEQKVYAQFDPADVKNERRATVDIGSGCAAQKEESSRLVYYGAGIGLLAVAVAAGLGVINKRQRRQKQGERPRK